MPKGEGGSDLMPRFGDPITEWMWAFAWLPTWTYDAGTVWLCRIWRRRIMKHEDLDGGADFWWQARRLPPGAGPERGQGASRGRAGINGH